MDPVKKGVAKLAAAGVLGVTAVTSGVTAMDMYHNAGGSLLATRIESNYASILKNLPPSIQEIVRLDEEADAGGGDEGSGGSGVPGQADVPKRDSDPVKVKAGELYQPMTNLKKNISSPQSVGGYTMYTGPTCNSTSNTYGFMARRATDVTFELLRDYAPGTQFVKNDVNWSLKSHMWTYEHTMSGSSWKKNGNIKKVGIQNIALEAPAAYTNVDNIKRYLIAAPAGVVNKSIYLDDKWKTKTGGDAADFNNYNRTLLADVVMTRSGKDYYLPVTFGDAKGHTYPGGICQTSIAASGGFFAYQGASGSDWTPHEQSTKENFPLAFNNLKTGKWGVNKYDATYSMHYLEMCIVSDKALQVLTNGEFELKCIIIYR